MPDVGARVCDSQQLRAIDDFDSLGSVVKIRAAAGRRPALHSQVPHPWLSCESENGAKNLFAPAARSASRATRASVALRLRPEFPLNVSHGTSSPFAQLHKSQKCFIYLLVRGFHRPGEFDELFGTTRTNPFTSAARKQAALPEQNNKISILSS
jgi:hypothetical protein